MTLLVEIRCDNRNEKNPDCWSHENSESFGIEKHTAQGAKEAALDAIKAYKDSAWLIYGDKAYCPSCLPLLIADNDHRKDLTKSEIAAMWKVVELSTKPLS